MLDVFEKSGNSYCMKYKNKLIQPLNEWRRIDLCPLNIIQHAFFGYAKCVYQSLRIHFKMQTSYETVVRAERFMLCIYGSVH